MREDFEVIKDISLRESLNFLRLVDLRNLVKDFKLEDVQKSRNYDELIEDIVKSPTIQETDIREKIFRISKLFELGGSGSIFLFKMESNNNSEFFKKLELFLKGKVNKEFKVEKNKFTIDKVKEFQFKNKLSLKIDIKYPKPELTYLDYKRGNILFTPVGHAAVYLTKYPEYILLDIRSETSFMETLLIFFKNHTIELVSENEGSLKFNQVKIDESLANKLKEKFNSVSFEFNMDDMGDEDGDYYRPANVKFKDLNVDLDSVRSKLPVSDAASMAGKSISFRVEFEERIIMNDCKLVLNYNLNRLTFTKNTPYVVYSIIIDTILNKK